MTRSVIGIGIFNFTWKRKECTCTLYNRSIIVYYSCKHKEKQRDWPYEASATPRDRKVLNPASNLCLEDVRYIDSNLTESFLFLLSKQLYFLNI
jgi:hypothetical protein